VLHLRLKRLDPVAIEHVDIVVALDHVVGQGRVALTVRPHDVLEHLVGQVRDPAHLDARRPHGDVGELDGVLAMSTA